MHVIVFFKVKGSANNWDFLKVTYTYPSRSSTVIGLSNKTKYLISSTNPKLTFAVIESYRMDRSIYATKKKTIFFHI